MSTSKEWIPRLKLLGGALCLDFANTTGRRIEPQGEEALLDYEDLVAWAEHAGAVAAAEARALLRAAHVEPERPRATHRRAIELREALFRIFSAAAGGRDVATADLDILNRFVGDAFAHLRLAPRDGGFVLAWRGAAGSLDLPLWRVARSAADLLVSPDVSRVRECSSQRCDWLFLDRSKNHSRRWCNMAECGNREKARRHYSRRRADAVSGTAKKGTR